ncbi:PLASMODESMATA CALLOSE-BINDING PROTEIN 2-like [Lotus japonicus]|uniref:PLASMODESMATA CALLOSE-BINDING PROTEIN 2-like n=1 Tax=Lotus japonicus TaxID=34305 RepID=UPI0025839550|nr:PLASMODESMATA CALLOSE-BINDING PROTEIN 2-like [Lotus japonicus]
MATPSSPKNSVSMMLLTIVITTMTMNVMIVGARWCIARSSASPSALQANLNFACAHGADCRAIQPGGSCYEPNTILNHASYAYDSYYQHMLKAPSACNFGGTATIAVTDPSFGRCVYPPRYSQRNDEGANTPILMSGEDKHNVTI